MLMWHTCMSDCSSFSFIDSCFSLFICCYQVLFSSSCWLILESMLS